MGKSEWKINRILFLVMAALLFLAIGCSDEDMDDDELDTDLPETPAPESPAPETPVPVTLTYTFALDLEGWEGGFADRPVEPEGMDLTYEYRELPERVSSEGGGAFISGKNTSDDLFMFIKRRIEVDALVPNTTYVLDFTVEFATESPSGCVGIGGPPGEAVRMKVGATVTEPTLVVEDTFYGISITKDPFPESGEKLDMIEIGHVGNTESTCHEFQWEMKTLSPGETDFTVTTGEAGDLWLIIGTDSGFEGETRLYYSRIVVTLTPLL